MSQEPAAEKAPSETGSTGKSTELVLVPRPKLVDLAVTRPVGHETAGNAADTTSRADVITKQMQPVDFAASLKRRMNIHGARPEIPMELGDTIPDPNIYQEYTKRGTDGKYTVREQYDPDAGNIIAVVEPSGTVVQIDSLGNSAKRVTYENGVVVNETPLTAADLATVKERMSRNPLRKVKPHTRKLAAAAAIVGALAYGGYTVGYNQGQESSRGSEISLVEQSETLATDAELAALRGDIEETSVKSALAILKNLSDPDIGAKLSPHEEGDNPHVEVIDNRDAAIGPDGSRGSDDDLPAPVIMVAWDKELSQLRFMADSYHNQENGGDTPGDEIIFDLPAGFTFPEVDGQALTIDELRRVIEDGTAVPRAIDLRGATDVHDPGLTSNGFTYYLGTDGVSVYATDDPRQHFTITANSYRASEGHNPDPSLKLRTRDDVTHAGQKLRALSDEVISDHRADTLATD